MAQALETPAAAVAAAISFILLQRSLYTSRTLVNLQGNTAIDGGGNSSTIGRQKRDSMTLRHFIRPSRSTASTQYHFLPVLLYSWSIQSMYKHMLFSLLFVMLYGQPLNI